MFTNWTLTNWGPTLWRSPIASLRCSPIHSQLGWGLYPKTGTKMFRPRMLGVVPLPSGKGLHNYGDNHHVSWENPLCQWPMFHDFPLFFLPVSYDFVWQFAPTSSFKECCNVLASMDVALVRITRMGVASMKIWVCKTMPWSTSPSGNGSHTILPYL